MLNKKIIDYLLNFLEIQLFLTLISLPICLSWGLQVSYLTILGNLLFAPFITLFLTISSLIFFCEIIGLSKTFIGTFFCFLLEKITEIWIFILSFANKSCLLSLIKPNLFFLIIIFIIPIIIISQKQKLSVYKIVFLEFIALLLILLILLIKKPKNNFHIIYQNNYKKIVLISKNNKNILIDYGVLNKINSEKIINFEIIPKLIKAYGVSSIDYIIFLSNISISSIKALTILSRRFRIKKIIIKKMPSKLTNKGWHAWQNLIRELKKQNIKIESNN